MCEPNFLVDGSRPPLPGDYVAHLRELVGAGRRGDAVEYFMTRAVGLPAEMVAPMRDMPMWSAMEAEAHTLPYDGAVVGESMSGKDTRARAMGICASACVGHRRRHHPVADGGRGGLAAALPQAARRTLEGETHDVDPEPLAPVLIEFFGGGVR